MRGFRISKGVQLLYFIVDFIDTHDADNQWKAVIARPR